MESIQRVLATISGNPLRFRNTLGDATILVVIYTVSGSPATLALTLVGLKASGEEAVLDNYAGTTSTGRAVSLSEDYDSFLLVPQWTGGANVSVGVLLATVGSGRPFQSTTAIAGLLQTKKVTVTSAQLRASDAVPIELVPAPGAGKCILPMGMFFNYHFGTVQYQAQGTGNTNTWTYYLDPAYQTDTEDGNILGGTADACSWPGPYWAGNLRACPKASFENLPLMMIGDTGVTISTGDGTLDVTTFYLVQDV